MDVALTWNAAEAHGDWSVVDGLLVGGSDLETAVLVSLFTDRVLPDDQTPPDGSHDRRGWWADTYREQPLGSRLWTLERAVKTGPSALLAEAKDICLEALGWLISDGVAASVQVQTMWLSATAIGIAVTITEPDGSISKFRYAWAWQGVG